MPTTAVPTPSRARPDRFAALGALDLLVNVGAQLREPGQRASAREPTIAFKHFAYEGLVARARAEIEWADAGLALVERLAEGGPDGPARLSDRSGDAAAAGR